MSIFGVFLVSIFRHYRVNLRIESEWGKIRTEKTPNTDTFYAVIVGNIYQKLKWFCLVFCSPSIYLKILSFFFSKNFFSKCDQIRRKLRIWSHLLKKSWMENFLCSTCAMSDNEKLFIYQFREMQRLYRRYAPTLVLLDATQRHN